MYLSGPQPSPSAPPQVSVGMDPEVPWCTGGTPDLTIIFADHPITSSILHIPLAYLGIWGLSPYLGCTTKDLGLLHFCRRANSCYLIGSVGSNSTLEIKSISLNTICSI